MPKKSSPPQRAAGRSSKTSSPSRNVARTKGSRSPGLPYGSDALSKNFGVDPAMMLYIQPLMKGPVSSASISRAMELGPIFWKMALLGKKRSQVENLMLETMEKLGLDDKGRVEFRETARMMIEHHKQMFPIMHMNRK